jgi:hypothetical protein
MRTITVQKAMLVDVLKNNRETHQDDFDLAYEGFRQKAMDNVETLLERLRKAPHGEPVQLWIQLEPPQNHIEDYDRALQMCEWEVGDQMELTETEFQQLVQDDWTWKQQFSTSNKLYTGSASPSQGRVL